MTIITVEEYKDFIGSTSTKEDARILELLGAVTKIIEGYIGYDVSPVGATKSTTLVTSKGRNSYFLDFSTEFSLVSVTYKDRFKNVYNIPLEDVVVAPSGRIDIIFPPVEIQDRALLVIEYTADNAVTEDLKLAAKLLTRYYFKDEYNVQSITASGASVSFITGKNLPPHVRTILDLHRNL
ncbi:hypothetical protein [Vibrio phage JSF12]|uniref:Head completion protein n=2 Tax=Jesfedecavirus TaxID=2560156 RepID=A0A2D0Z1K1_9CAUD|nr:hypothetical protein FDI98_gp059 [Vibrio phage JSF10]YP_009794791.1 hypothetical protein HOS35_gp108 [Vibrio phage JSF12]ASV43473.1 hypothetical protein [Vibrio phage JSF10]ASV43626.1 hypothetical protein [Vibrio phage JSF12]